LHLAAQIDIDKAAEILLDAGAEIDSLNKSLQNPLSLAALKNSLDVAELLIERGVNINVCDEDGDTPLILALLSDSGNIPIHHYKTSLERLRSLIASMAL
jgi:ankyrin repeat protein